MDLDLKEISKQDEDYRKIVKNKKVCQNILDNYDLISLKQEIKRRMLLSNLFIKIARISLWISLIFIIAFFSLYFNKNEAISQNTIAIGIVLLILLLIFFSFSIIASFIKADKNKIQNVWLITKELIQNDGLSSEFLDYPNNLWVLFFSSDANLYLTSLDLDEKIKNQWLDDGVKEVFRRTKRLKITAKVYSEYLDFLNGLKTWDNDWDEKFNEAKNKLFGNDGLTNNSKK